ANCNDPFQLTLQMLVIVGGEVYRDVTVHSRPLIGACGCVYDGTRAAASQNLCPEKRRASHTQQPHHNCRQLWLSLRGHDALQHARYGHIILCPPYLVTFWQRNPNQYFTFKAQMTFFKV
uniref:Uncharacterized protein n=1 Tax=Oryzias latipes TaxID=8090 RepID=A0A3B3HZN2_ORYLA